ncbi:hypothetical protein [Rhodopirellula europaea]|uniref:Uncharacterized protein n=1 Tax=Rhodopirellula europaea 6C TaxID=1263867 RepID=M2AVV6_9BACT|nr:hypothetical protein [Rhodopirellula europaea]EMB13668.1 hypothetical protein RE6C_05614 [Rhodopirellula europaea 6C]
MSESGQELYKKEFPAFIEAIIDDLAQSGVQMKSAAELNHLLMLAWIIQPENGWPNATKVASTILDRFTMLLRCKVSERNSGVEASPLAGRFANDWEGIKACIQDVGSELDALGQFYFDSARKVSLELFESVPASARQSLVELGYQPESHQPDLSRLDDVLSIKLAVLARNEPLLDCDEDDDEDELDGLFGFKIEDKIIVEAFIGAAKAALSRDDVSNADRINIAKFMHCLQQLPRMTPNISFDFTLKTPESKEGFGYRSVQITDDEFKVSVGEYVVGPFGGDSSTQILFEVGEGWQDTDLVKGDLLGWAQQFEADASDEGLIVSIDDYAGEEIDMDDAEDTSHLWDRLDSDYV